MARSSIKSSNHYDKVTDVFKEIIGDNLHYGFFDPPTIDLHQAQYVQIDKLLDLLHITSGSSILDVGCGIGNPAFYIHEKYKCPITGISTSTRGIELANIASRERGYYPEVQFIVADGLNNGLPDNQFDIVWVMESSVLMFDKQQLARECFRVLKPQGTMVLCDTVLLNNLPIYKWWLMGITEWSAFIKTWGWTEVISPGAYCDRLLQAGFSRVDILNVSHRVIPTLQWWITNAERQGGSLNNFSKKDMMRFIKSCKFTERLFQDGVLGYSMLRAVKT